VLMQPVVDQGNGNRVNGRRKADHALHHDKEQQQIRAAIQGRHDTAISLIGPNGLFLFTGSILALLTLFTLWRIIRFPSIPPKEQEPFVTSMPVSDVSILNELDPRNEEFVASPPIHERRRDDRPRPENPEAGSSGRSTRED